jgi:hypothetical protein
LKRLADVWKPATGGEERPAALFFLPRASLPQEPLPGVFLIGFFACASPFAPMDALKAAQMLRLVLFTMARTTCVVLATALILLLMDLTVENTSIFDMPMASLPSAGLALLMGIPVGLFLLSCAASLWEEKLRERNRVREKECLRETLERFPPSGLSGAAQRRIPRRRAGLRPGRSSTDR